MRPFSVLETSWYEEKWFISGRILSPVIVFWGHCFVIWSFRLGVGEDEDVYPMVWWRWQNPDQLRVKRRDDELLIGWVVGWRR